MTTTVLRKIIGFILAALLLTSIVLLAGTAAGAQRRHQRRVISTQSRTSSRRSIDRLQPAPPVETTRPFQTYGPFGRSYHPFFDPYGRYDSYTFYRHSIGRRPN
jgi:hypothetical protein